MRSKFKILKSMLLQWNKLDTITEVRSLATHLSRKSSVTHPPTHYLPYVCRRCAWAGLQRSLAAHSSPATISLVVHVETTQLAPVVLLARSSPLRDDFSFVLLCLEPSAVTWCAFLSVFRVASQKKKPFVSGNTGLQWVPHNSRVLSLSAPSFQVPPLPGFHCWVIVYKNGR